jgi:hypothetical protein
MQTVSARLDIGADAVDNPQWDCRHRTKPMGFSKVFQPFAARRGSGLKCKLGSHTEIQ